ncbi:glycosyltransferase family 2 protein [Moraxella bovoculi]|uniref:glycosyltransferase family 2 protein n=1 Tax=Moraxella bovoculi TaxID=386891 RepID=UPI0012D42BD6|nr:glycosyltransferase family 2 protein [Moraxella bovoculi]
MPEPSIDVIIPCYNAADTIERAVMSVLIQSNLGRIYLIDDGSVDETWQVITRLQKNHPNLIHIERLPINKGVATARNWGAMLAKSDFIAFLDADDSYQS